MGKKPRGWGQCEILDNKDYPMVAYSIACDITPFDDFDAVYAGQTNIGKSFTLGKNYGGPLLIGNTRAGIVETTYKVQQLFNSNIKECSVADALNKAKYANLSHRHHNALVVNLIGTPDMYIWTRKPQRFNARIEYDGMSAALFTESNIQEAYYCVRHLSELGDSISKNVFSPSFYQSTLTDIENGLITLTGRNCIPQVMPFYLQNINLYGKRYLHVSDTHIGSNVRDYDEGNVVLKSGSHTTIKHTGEVELSKGVIIEKGATLTIIPSKIKK